MSGGTAFARSVEVMLEDELFYRAAVGAKADYYVPRFREFDQFGSNRISWSWPAFFVAIPWMLYRKMYGYALAYLFFVPFTLRLLEVLSKYVVGSTATVLVSRVLWILAFFVVVPMYANAMYHTTVGRRILKAQKVNSTLQGQLDYLERRKGTSIVSAIIGALLVAGSVGYSLWQRIAATDAATVTAQVLDGMRQTTWIQAEVEYYYRNHGEQWPVDESAFDFSGGHGRYVSSIQIHGGRILVVFGNEAAQEIAGKVFTLTPFVYDRGIVWECDDRVYGDLSPVPVEYFPESCG